MAASSSFTPELTSVFDGQTYSHCNVDGCSCTRYRIYKRKNAKAKCTKCSNLPCNNEKAGAAPDDPTYNLQEKPLMPGSYSHPIPYVKEEISKRIGKVKQFSGENNYSATRYCQDIQSKTTGMADHVTLAVLLMNLSKTAKKWHESLPYEYHTTPKGIKEFQNDLQTNFPANSETLYHTENITKKYNPDKRPIKYFLLNFQESAKAIRLTDDQTKLFLLAAIKCAYPGDMIELEKLQSVEMLAKITRKFKKEKKKGPQKDTLMLDRYLS